MRRDFTAQTPKQIAKILASDWRWIMEYVWLSKTGNPPRPFDDYDPLTLSVLLSPEMETAVTAKAPRKRKVIGRWGPPTLGGYKPVEYGTAITTGDPVADEWERQLASGKIPDW